MMNVNTTGYERGNKELQKGNGKGMKRRKKNANKEQGRKRREDEMNFFRKKEAQKRNKKQKRGRRGRKGEEEAILISRERVHEARKAMVFRAKHEKLSKLADLRFLCHGKLESRSEWRRNNHSPPDPCLCS